MHPVSVFCFAVCKTLRILWDRWDNVIIAQKFSDWGVLRTTNLGCLIFIDHDIFFLTTQLSYGKTPERLLNEDSTQLLPLSSMAAIQHCYKVERGRIVLIAESFFVVSTEARQISSWILKFQQEVKASNFPPVQHFACNFSLGLTESAPKMMHYFVSRPQLPNYCH